MTVYLIAVKRERRADAPRDWSRRLRQIPGLTVTGGADPYRVQVEATDDAIARARRELGDLCHIEPAIPHRPLG